MKNSHRAFTLIELLMVLGIITLLAALFYAAYGPAREKARQAVCISNLHQYGIAFSLYRQDYDGADPVKGEPMTCYQLGLPDVGPMADAFLKAYVKDSKKLRCPDWHVPGLPVSVMAITYQWWPDKDSDMPNFTEKYSRMVSRDGYNVPLLVDNQHNPPFDISKAPRWTPELYLVLRLSQQVDRRILPIREDESHL